METFPKYPKILVGQTTIPQIPYQDQHIQTQLFQPFQGYEGTRQLGYIYPSYQNLPYPGMQIMVSQPIPLYPRYPPP